MTRENKIELIQQAAEEQARFKRHADYFVLGIRPAFFDSEKIEGMLCRNPKRILEMALWYQLRAAVPDTDAIAALHTLIDNL